MTKTWDSTLGDSLEPVRARPKWTARIVAIGGRVVDERPFVLSPGRTEVGRAVAPIDGQPGRGGIALKDPRVSRSHAILDLDGKSLAVARCGDAVVRVDGAVRDESALSDGSVLVLGASALVFRYRPLDEEPSVPSWGLLGDAPSTRALRRTIRMIGPTPSTVLLLGESGTGKELAARALHEASGRKGPLVAVNTSAIPATLAEAHLFGHVAGAYTGATTASSGVFRAADGGTLFLDELADLPAELQPKLLRVLEDQVVVPVGTTKGTTVDVRVICATNKDLLGEVDAGRFRGDLYARISDFTVELPPLSARREDILSLLSRELGADPPPLSPELLAELLSRPYRFNVRELKKLGTQLRVRGAGEAKLTIDMIDRAAGPEERTPSSSPSSPSRAPEEAARVPTQAELEAMLAEHHGVIEEIAQRTGRSRRQVHRWLEKYGLDVDRYRRR
jgi:DNA-binding NtrC family response regulator